MITQNGPIRTSAMGEELWSHGTSAFMFAHKMGELSDAFGLGYEVCAKPLDQAILAQEPFDAVMLAPQVAFERNRVAAAYPEALVFEIPARIFGGYDAAGAVRLLSNALDGHNRGVEGERDQSMMPQDLVWPGRIMVVTAVLGSRQSTFEYRVDRAWGDGACRKDCQARLRLPRRGGPASRRAPAGHRRGEA